MTAGRKPSSDGHTDDDTDDGGGRDNDDDVDGLVNDLDAEQLQGTIAKMADLLATGFGDAGVEIIKRHLGLSDAETVSLFVAGTKVRVGTGGALPVCGLNRVQAWGSTRVAFVPGPRLPASELFVWRGASASLRVNHSCATTAPHLCSYAD
jgi:hypothetical protein